MNKKIVFLPVFCFAIYTPAFFGGFYYDDIHSIVENPHIRSWSYFFGYFSDPSYFSGDSLKQMYRPLLLTTYMVNYAVSGYETWSYHFFNILIHALCSICILFIANRTVFSFSSAYLAAFFFIVNPLATEPVNYISSRSESLAALFYLLFLLCFLRGENRSSLGVYGSYIGGLLCKSVALSAPMTIFFYDLYKGKRIEVLPYCGYLVVAIIYLSIIYFNGFLSGSIAEPVRTVPAQLFTQLKAVVYYAYLGLFPINLSLHHPFIESVSWYSVPVICSFMFTVSMVFLLFVGRKMIVGWCLAWMGIALLPTFFMPLNMMVNERRLYLPLAAMAVSMSWFFSKISHKKVIFSVLCVIWSSLTIQRTIDWNDELTLWTKAAELAPNEYTVLNNLGKSLQQIGNLDEALDTYKRAIELDDTKGEVYNNIATVYHDRGERYIAEGNIDSGYVELNQAKTWYNTALLQGSQYGDIHANLAAAHVLLKENDSSYAHFKTALYHNEYKAVIWNNYGQALYDGGYNNSAENAFRMALTLDSLLVEPRNNLGNIEAKLGNWKEAEYWYESALSRATGVQRNSIVKNLLSVLRQTRRFHKARNLIFSMENFDDKNGIWQYELGDIEYSSGRTMEAETAYTNALKTLKHLPLLYVKRGEIRLKEKNVSGAIDDYESALALDSTFVRALYGLGRGRMLFEQKDRAIAVFKKFLELWPNNDEKALKVRQWIDDMEPVR